MRVLVASVGVLSMVLFMEACGSDGAETACKRDVDCPNGFCDRNTCATVGAKGRENYGIACEPISLPPVTDPLGHPVNRCGSFLCLDTRCRSCTHDAECKSILGSPTCGTVPDWPGRSCGNYSVGDAGESRPPDAATEPRPPDAG
jgi:hypothetical protein